MMFPEFFEANIAAMLHTGNQNREGNRENA